MKKILKLPPLTILAGILGLEAILSLMDLSVLPGAMLMTMTAGKFLPVVDNFMRNTAVPSSVAPYIALTCVLTPVKVFVAYLYVVRLPPREKSLIVCFPSSHATISRKIFGTFLVLMLSVGFAWYASIYGDTSYFNTDVPPGSALAKYHLVSAGGIRMWLGWSVMHLAMMTLVLGLLVAFVDEWFRFLEKFKARNYKGRI